MVDITEISAIVAAIGILVGVAYYILDMRNQTRIRKTDLIIRLYSFIANKELLEAWEKVRDREFKDADDYKKKYGGLVELNLIYTLYQEFGMLLQRKLIDTTLIEDLIGRRTALLVYEKLKGFHEDTMRERIGTESSSFDYLYNEMKKREQKGVRNG